MSLFETTLYQRGARNETRVWSVCVKECDINPHHAIVLTSYGVMDGAMNEVSRVIESGKNIGKSNETTPHEQGVMYAKSLAKKKSREGYAEEMSERGKVPVILPMLAHDWNKVKKRPTVPLYVQPKIDGVRMIAVRDTISGEIVLTTRTGKPITSMGHIEEELKSVMPRGFVFDGELFSTERTFEEITGIVRRNTVKSGPENDPTSIQYYLFDAFQLGCEKAPFEIRARLLYGMRLKDTSPIVIVDTDIITDEKEIDSVHERFVQEGHEGTMYRTPTGLYKIRLRSNDLLKRKDFETEEYPIIGAVEAEGKDKGSVIWACSTEDDQHFYVRPRGTLAMRTEWWENRDQYIGKRLTVRYQNLSESGIPRFPVGIAIRDYE